MRSKQEDKLQGEDGSKRLEPQFPSPSHTSLSHTSPVGKKESSERCNVAERADGRGVGVSRDGRKEGGPSVGRGGEGAPISSPAWKLMAKELAR